jgi:translin
MDIKTAEKELTKAQKEKEKLLPLSRGIVQDCAKAIRLVHTYDEKKSKAMLRKVRKDVKRLQRAAAKRPQLTSLLLVPEQEWVELEMLVAFMDGDELPEVKCGPAAYLLGVMDGIGECKRVVIDMLSENLVEDADDALEWLEDTYYEVHAMSFPKSLVPGLKHKQDAMKRVLDSLHNAVRDAEARVI